MSTEEHESQVRDDAPRQLRNPCLPCASAHRTRPADVGKTVCFHCTNRILGWLSDVEHAVLSLELGTGGPGRRAPGFGSRSPARDDVLSALDPRSRAARVLDDPTGYTSLADETLTDRPILATLHAVATSLAEQQGHARSLTVATVTSEVTYIRQSQPYWSTCDWVDELGDDLRELANMVKRLRGEHRPKRVGTCPTLVRGEECGEPLFAPLDGDTIKCRKCKREWGRSDWLRLGRLLESA